MIALFGLLFIVIGVISLVKRDWMWALTKMGNDFEGEASHRNELWELRTMIGGVVAIILGVVLILLPAPAAPTLQLFPDPEVFGTPFPGP